MKCHVTSRVLIVQRAHRSRHHQ